MDDRFYMKVVEISETLGAVRENQLESNRKLDALVSDLGEVKVETKKTNGRVTKLEHLTEEQAEQIKKNTENAELLRNIYEHISRRHRLYLKYKSKVMIFLRPFALALQERANYVLALAIIVMILLALQERYKIISEILKLI